MSKEDSTAVLPHHPLNPNGAAANGEPPRPTEIFIRTAVNDNDYQAGSAILQQIKLFSEDTQRPWTEQQLFAVLADEIPKQESLPRGSKEDNHVTFLPVDKPSIASFALWRPSAESTEGYDVRLWSGQCGYRFRQLRCLAAATALVSLVTVAILCLRRDWEASEQLQHVLADPKASETAIEAARAAALFAATRAQRWGWSAVVAISGFVGVLAWEIFFQATAREKFLRQTMDQKMKKAKSSFYGFS